MCRAQAVAGSRVIGLRKTDPEFCQCRGEIRWERRGDDRRGAGERVGEAGSRAVKEEPAEAGARLELRVPGAVAVADVAGEVCSEMREVCPDLMPSPGHGFHLDQARAAGSSENAVVRDGFHGPVGSITAWTGRRGPVGPSPRRRGFGPAGGSITAWTGRRGFTLVEMLVAMSIFIALGGALVAMSHQAMEAWRVGETKRLAYERAEAVFSQMALDLNAAYTRGPATAKGVPMARLFCTGGGGAPQRLSFVRTFETGPERSITYYAGSAKGATTDYTDSFTGDPRTLRPLGGLLGVTYHLDGRKLRRAALGPPATPGKNLRRK